MFAVTDRLPTMIGEPCIAVLACGTRGDVQPLLSLAIELCDGATVTLVTHSDHQVRGGV